MMADLAPQPSSAKADPALHLHTSQGTVTREKPTTQIEIGGVSGYDYAATLYHGLSLCAQALSSPE